MATNKDGLEAGQPVDFETLMRIKAEQRRKKDAEAPKAKQRGRKKAVRQSDQSEAQDVSESTDEKEA